MNDAGGPSAQGASRAGLAASVARFAAVTWVSLALLGLIDAAVVLVRSRAPLPELLRYALYALLLAALPALLLGALLGCLAHLGAGLVPARFVAQRPALSALVRALAWGSVAGAAGLFVSRSWELAIDTYHLGPLSFLGPLLGVAALRLSGSRFSARTVGACALSIAGGLLAADMLVLRGLYTSLHDLVALGASACAAYGVALWAPRLGRHRPGTTLAMLVAGCLALGLLGDSPGARSLGAIHGAVLPKLASVVRALGDRDLDGHALWGADCDDGDPEVYPGACEQLDTPRDENCNGWVAAAEPPRAQPGPRVPDLRDVYLVLIDALRADCGGPGRAQLAPNFERFAQGALDFEKAYSPYPSTYRAMSALSTSRYHRYRSPRVPPFTTWLRTHGYDSQLWLAGAVLRDEAGRPPPVGPDRTTSDPFEVSEQGKTTWTTAIIDRAVAELRDAPDGPPRLRWLHLLDTHGPLLRGREGASERERYLAEAAFVDAQLGRLFAALDASPRGRRAAVIVLADHGEELGEHGGRFHGAMLWESSIHVPLSMRLPGVAPRRVPGPASLIDVLPTLAHYLGLAPLPGWQGHDWLDSDRHGPRVVSQTEALDALSSAGLPARVAVTDGRLKLIGNVSEQLTDVYDLARDPAELHNLGGRPDLPGLTDLTRALRAWEDLPECAAPSR